MTYHAMFSLYIMTGLLALVISVSLFCKSVAEAKVKRLEDKGIISSSDFDTWRKIWRDA